MRKIILPLLLLSYFNPSADGQTTNTVRQVVTAGTAITRLPSPLTLTVSPTDTIIVFKSPTWYKAPASVFLTPPQLTGLAWLLLGNSGTVAGTNFLGTIDSVDLVFKTNSNERMRLIRQGSVGGLGIGTSLPTAQLHVEGINNIVSTYAAKFENSSLVNLLNIHNSGQIEAGDPLGNLFIGTSSGLTATFLNAFNTGIGVETFMFLDNSGFGGDFNTAVGYGAGRNTTGGIENVLMGYLAGTAITTGNFNSLIGSDAGSFTTTGSRNMVLGANALVTNTTGSSNIAIGQATLGSQPSGDYNVAIGEASMFMKTTGDRNVALGAYSGTNQTIISERLFIDNKDRGSAAFEQTKGLIYGVFGTDSSDQSFRINGKLQVSDGTQANGDVFTSDANGIGSWLSPSTQTVSITAGAGIGVTGSVNTFTITNTSPFDSTHCYTKLRVDTIQPCSPLVLFADTVIIPNGRLGIGTSFPDAALDVNGDIFLTGADRALSWNGTSASMILDNNNNYALGSDRLIITFGTPGFALYDQDNFNQMLRAGVTEGVTVPAVRIAPNLIASISYGSSVSGGNKTIRSTTHATKGKVIFGTNQSAFDEVNNRFGIGTITPLSTLHVTGASGSTIRIVDGNQGVGKVLTSDADGDGTWTTPAVGTVLSGSATLDFPSTLAASSSDLTITVTGAVDGDVVSMGAPNGSVNTNTAYFAWVSAANTVTIRFINFDVALASDPASGTFKVKIFQ